MQRSRFACAVAVLVMLGTVGSHAAAAQSAASTSGAAEPAVAETLSTSTIESKQLHSLLGREVRTASEENAGRVIDILADRAGRVDAAVIEFGGFMGLGTRKIAVEWSALRFLTDGKQAFVQVELSRDQLRRAPEYKPGEVFVVLRSGQ